VTEALSPGDSSSTALGHTQSKSTAINERTSMNSGWHVRFTHRVFSHPSASQRHRDEDIFDGRWMPHHY